MTLDVTSFEQHLTGLVEQSTNPVSISAGENITSENLPGEKYSPSFIIAYSGGIDSHVLLHLMHAAGFNCRAVYIDHGLQQESGSWSEHCAQVCQQLGVDFKTITVNAEPARGESPEASARGARYQALAVEMDEGDILLTAQHQNDQSETLFLQMLRTAGPAGLSAMPVSKVFASGRHMRPLLHKSQAELEAYAQAHELNWIEDPSNQDNRFDRNFLRNQIFPLLQDRWPSIHNTLANVSNLQAEAALLMNDLASIDAAETIDGATILIEALTALPVERQRNLVRYWLQQNALDVPTAKRMDEILGTVINAGDDKTPVVSWQQTEVRRFQGRLYAMKSLPEIDVEAEYTLEPEIPTVIEDIEKAVLLQPASQGLSADVINQPLSIRFRRGGEKIKPVGRSHTQDLKKLMQQAGIPPWQRSRLPLLYLDDKLIAVADYWVADDCKNQPNQPGWLLKTVIL